MIRRFIGIATALSRAGERLHNRRFRRDPGRVRRTAQDLVGEEAITDPQIASRRSRSIHLGEQIGKGGFGAVYRATQTLIEREVAIKVILPQYADQPEFIRRFEAEAQLVARLEHPHIVPLYDYWREPGVAFLVMRLLRGGSLHNWLQQGPLPIETTAQLIAQIGGAVHVAHAAGVVHRDLKPANILLDDARNAYLADFGIAKDLAQPHEAISLAGAFVGSPAYSSPEQIRAEPVTPQTDIYALGILLYELLTGQRPFNGPNSAAFIQQHLTASVPPLAEQRSGMPSELDNVIQRATAKVPSARYTDALEFVAAMQAALGDHAVAVGAERPGNVAAPPTLILDLLPSDNPYRGLRPFAEADAAHFFGREAFVQRLLTRMGESGELARFLAVIGPSGSGKSSLVCAGLLPALRSGGLRGSEQWYLVDLLPGADPIGELAAALRRVAPAGIEREDLRAVLQADARGLLRATRLVLPPGPETELVLLIDQFEELFTLCPDPAIRAHVLDSLVIAALDERSRVRIVMTLRADFIDRPLQYVDFGELLTRRSELVAPLTPDELERAVVGPAQRAGLALEDGLVAAIVADVGDQPGALPLLQHALSELFTRRAGRVLSRTSYTQIGGVSGALAQSADACYHTLDPEGQAVARRVLLALVSPGDGVEDTRRRIQRVALRHAGPPGVVDTVLEQFGNARLLTFDHDPFSRVPTVEVAHEALLRAWPRLANWIDAARADLRLHQQLARSADEWQAADRDPSFLASGVRREQYDALATSATLALSDGEQSYLAASRAEAERTAQAEEERRAHELEQARQLAEEQQRRAEAAQQVAQAQRSAAGRLRALVVGLTLFLAIALGLSLFAFGQREQAQVNAAEAEANFVHAEAQRLAAEANVVAQTGGSAELVALLALRSLQLEYTPQGDAVLATAAALDLPGQSYSGHSDWIHDLAFAPDGAHFVTAGQDKTARLWNVAAGREVRVFSGYTGAIHGIAFSPDGRTILTGSQDKTVRIWDVAAGQELAVFSGPEKPVWGVAFAPDGTLALGGSYDKRAYMWNVATGQVVTTFEHPREVYGVAFAPDGATIVTGSHDGKVRIWDVVSGSLLRELEGHTEQVRAVAFAPDGATVLSGSHDKTARLWAVESGTELVRLNGHREFIWDVLYSPDGATVYTASQDKSVRQWALEPGLELHQLNGHGNYVLSAAISTDGAQLVTAGREGVVRMWSAQPGALLPRFLGHTSDLHWAAFSPDSAYVLSGSLDDTARLWDAATGQLVRSFAGHTNDVHNVAFSPDGQRIGTASFDGTAAVWDVASGERLYVLPSAGATVFTIVFAPDGRLVATSGDDSDPTVRIWDATDGSPVRVLTGHSGGIHALAFAPDGNRLLSGSYDKTAKLWDLHSGALIETFAIPDGAVSLAFAPDGRTFVTGSSQIPSAEAAGLVLAPPACAGAAP
jgi:WD40 repeat protein